jgi:hypothetical protein
VHTFKNVHKRSGVEAGDHSSKYGDTPSRYRWNLSLVKVINPCMEIHYLPMFLFLWSFAQNLCTWLFFVFPVKTCGFSQEWVSLLYWTQELYYPTAKKLSYLMLYVCVLFGFYQIIFTATGFLKMIWHCDPLLLPISNGPQNLQFCTFLQVPISLCGNSVTI